MGQGYWLHMPILMSMPPLSLLLHLSHLLAQLGRLLLLLLLRRSLLLDRLHPVYQLVR